MTVGAFLVERQVKTVTRKDAESDLHTSLQVIEELARERREQRRSQAALLARSEGLLEGLDRGDRDLVKSSLEHLAGPLLGGPSKGLSLVVIDGEGGVQAATGEMLANHSLDDLLPSPRVHPIDEALRGTRPGPEAVASGVWVVGEALLEVAAAPAVTTDGRRVGAVILTERLSQAVALRLREMSPSSHVVILADRQLVASSLDPEEARRVRELFPETAADAPVRDPSSHAGAREVRVDGVRHLAQLVETPIHYGGLFCHHIVLRSLEPATELASAIRRNLLLVLLGAVALAFAATWLGARHIAHPLRRLAETMSHISQSGRLEPPPAVNGGGRELRLLQSAFHRMLGSLAEAERARERSYVEAIGAVMAAVDRRDQESAGHSYRVAYYAVALARNLGLEGDELRAVEWGALLHDVGKIAVPDQILRKSGPLTEKEWQIMRQHPRWGYEMLVEVEFLHPALDIVYNHHERWDGTGYPRGLRGEDIPMAARIFSVVDTYDAITADRHYRDARSHRDAVAELQRVGGSQLDPRIVESFLELSLLELRQLRKLSGEAVAGIRIPSPIQEILAELRTGTRG